MNTIIGHDVQIKLIEGLLISNKFPNSIILSGPEGIGKSLVAKNISSKLLGDLDISSPYYDNIDIKNSNELILKKLFLEDKKRYKQKIYRDDIKYIHNFFSTKNDFNKKKVCIIDSLDELSVDAKNSLLKIIEEPNLNNHFILISHNKNSLLPTIKSRSYELVFNHLKKSNFIKIIKNYNDIEHEDFNYMYSLTKGSLSLYNDYLKYNFREIDDHLTSLIKDRSLVKSNTADHYIKFLDNESPDREIVKSFMNFFILKISLIIRENTIYLTSSKIKFLLNKIDQLKDLKEKFVTFNLAHDHLLLHYFNGFMNVK